MSGVSRSGGEAVRLRATSTHLYRGARLLATAGLPSGPAAAVIEFGDGVVVEAELLRSSADELALQVPAYRTAAGSDLAEKSWRVGTAGAVGADAADTAGAADAAAPHPVVLVVGARIDLA